MMTRFTAALVLAEINRTILQWLAWTLPYLALALVLGSTVVGLALSNTPRTAGAMVLVALVLVGAAMTYGDVVAKRRRKRQHRAAPDGCGMHHSHD